MHEWIIQNGYIVFGIIASIWCIKWLFCLIFRSPNGKWTWEK